jgi:hypothetical protein
MMFTGFCNQYNPRTHLPTFSNPINAAPISPEFPLMVMVSVLGQHHLIKDDVSRAYTA